MEKTLDRLAFLCNHIPGKLRSIDSNVFAHKPSIEKWSKKEIIGHLIDSAANNHQRFVRGQFDDYPFMKYDQNKWNTCSFHQEIEAEQLINFWTVYNRQILEIVKRIPVENLKRQIEIGSESYTLEFVIVDYVDHMEHHLKQVIEY